MAKKIRVKRKKKWIQGLHLKKGRFTEWCKRHGFSGVTDACIEMALKSGDKSVIGMANFAKRARAGEFK